MSTPEYEHKESTNPHPQQRVHEAEAAAAQQVDQVGEQAAESARQEGGSQEQINQAVQSARQQEKDKLYPMIQELKDSVKELQQANRDEREEKEEIKRKAEEEAENKRLSKLTEEQKQSEVLNRLEEQLKEVRAERQQFKTELDERERKQEINEYRKAALQAVSDSGDGIIPELVIGTNKAEIDAAIQTAKARFAEIEERLKQRQGDNVRRNMPSSTNPDTAAQEEQELQQLQNSVDRDRYLKDPQYAESIKQQLADAYTRAAGGM